MSPNRVIAIASVAAWLMAGVPVVLEGDPKRMVGWGIAYALFGAAFLADFRRPSLPLLATCAFAVTTMVLLLCDGFEGSLLVLVAMRLGGRVNRATGLGWIAAQTALLAAAVAFHWTPRAAWLLTPPYLGFQILAFFAFELMAREMRVNAELRATRTLVADASRIAERLRIAQELHDALGHRLTALTLNLESALVRGGENEDLTRAQSLARELLGDVRTIVAEKQASGDVDLADALRALIGNVPRPAVHINVDDAPRIDDPERAHAIVRCVQEVVTNAARHSGAENLWIVVERVGDGYRIRARDDGRGRGAAREGFGLAGMRRRIEHFGGELRVLDDEGGFGIIAFLPARGAVT